MFVRGATEAINLVARTWGGRNVGPGDEILVSADGASLQHRPLADLCEGRARACGSSRSNDAWRAAPRRVSGWCSERTRLVAVTHVSNAIGTINPMRAIAAIAHARGAPVLVDGAQAVAAPARSTCRRSTATSTSSRATRSSARPASACSTAGPTLLEEMPPFLGGGEMIRRSRSRRPPTPPCRTASRPERRTSRAPSAWPRRIDYLTGLDLRRTSPPTSTRCSLRRRAPGGASPASDHRHAPRAAGRVVSFVVEGVHAHDIGSVLDRTAWPSGPATTARSRCSSASASPPRRGPRWRSTTRPRTSTPWFRASRG